MKRFHAAFLLLGILLFSCSFNAKEQQNLITISGKIEGAPNESIILYSWEELERIPLANDGSFHFTFEFDYAFYFNLILADTRFQLYLEPGDEIFFTADLADFRNTFHAEGDKAKEAMYLSEKYDYMMIDLWYMYSLEKDAYYAEKEKMLEPFRRMYNELLAEPGIDASFLKLESVWLDYWDLNQDQNYMSFYRREHGLARDAAIDFPEEQVYERLDTINLNDPLILINTQHRMIIFRRLQQLRSELYSQMHDSLKSNSMYIARFMDAVDSLVSNPRANDLFKYWDLSMWIGMHGPCEYKDILEVFLKSNATPMFANRLNRLVESWQAILPGNEVPSFLFTDWNDQTVGTDQWKGKNSYIMVWDTGCGPSRYEQGLWNELVDEIKSENLQFIAIGIDREKETWREEVINFGTRGLNWYDERGIQSDFNKHFLISGVPKFMLVDAGGRIIQADAPRPSANIREVLQPLL